MGAPAGAEVFGQFESAAGRGLGELDTTTGQLTKIESYGVSRHLGG